MKSGKHLSERGKKVLAFLREKKVKVDSIQYEVHAPEGDSIFTEHGEILVSTDPREAEITLIGTSPEVGCYWLSLKEFKRGFMKIVRAPRCPDCGKYGEQAGHMECQYPQDHK